MTRGLIAGIVVVIVGIYYVSEIRPFAYHSYETNLNQLQRYDAELNEALVQIRFGIKKYYNPIDKALDGMHDTLQILKEELVQSPNFAIKRVIAKDVAILEKAINDKEEISLHFKRINPVLINAIYQFSIVMAEIIENQASTQAVESSNLQEQYAQL
ncbi:MAG TPA: hypothetical protein PLD88_01780, partial [Candidatus Berkiella sp.]|nr:hypothetical protein [Candidatus Berkiella sp.]